MAWMTPHADVRRTHHDFLEASFECSEDNTKSKGRRRKKLLFKTVRDQMEFYFSDANLSKDRFLRQLVEDDPFVPLEIFLKFNKINQLVSSVEDIAKALKKSETLELSEDSLKVHRKLPMKARDNEDDCTLYVENLPPEITHDQLTKVFSEFGKVVYVSIPKYRNTHLIKGFAFVEFETPKDAAETIRIFKEKGSCLSPHMLPEKLCSIRTFDQQNYSENQKSMLEKKSECLKASEDENAGSDGNEMIGEVTKDCKDGVPEEICPRKRKCDREDQMDNVVNQIVKKVKHENENRGENKVLQENAAPDQKTAKNMGVKKNKSDHETEESDNLSSPEKNGEEEKKKKKRKKKRRPKEKEAFANGMVVLFKKEWKRLRNKYLNMQRVNMRRVKQQVLEARFMRRQPHVPPPGLEHSRDDEMRPPPPPVDAPKPRVSFIPGVIVRVTFNEPVSDIKAFKAEGRAQPGVQYVDVCDGACEAFLRCSTPSDATHLLQTKFWKNMSLLNGKDETDYWDKIFQDREAKLGNKVRVVKERGRKKLLRKAEIVKSTHLHFDS